ncbi:MAG: heavy-metal-associated domain-containing protein [Peptoniphilaceae bacterium]|nr:heavy-metal-associated domain-containing protein [Peptoniphilaceae bacterium]MDD7434706.1 heavy-metal-associated domain-containing protein [Peptoniphilaceae bacterium]MDD7543310.1 heavy-metal-associated domain-containing protein [Peptoniphilaceae bacterium]MDY3075484.1 heavy-metal-associated domain-containing protein [Peptoniphilaceae bacterium]MDY3987581.1 heavy-metal-associated domain-containing protein [Peptoniphilaceae bacterium]
MKKKYTLEGLCCGECAAEIEREVSRLPGVQTAAVNFVMRRLTVETESAEAQPDRAQLQRIAQIHDPDIVVK